MRNDFKDVSGINIVDLQLDTVNPRLGELANQTECIAMMLEEMEKKIENTAKHIGKFGLSPEHIVVVPFANNIICQLAPDRYDTIPEYVVVKCDELVADIEKDLLANPPRIAQ